MHTLGRDLEDRASLDSVLVGALAPELSSVLLGDSLDSQRLIGRGEVVASSAFARELLVVVQPRDARAGATTRQTPQMSTTYLQYSILRNLIILDQCLLQARSMIDERFQTCNIHCQSPTHTRVQDGRYHTCRQ